MAGVLGLTIVGLFVWRGLEATEGIPAAPLDDPYIHFQYARTIVEGRPFEYHRGEPPSSGASSLVYVALLVVPYALGLQGTALLWGAWLIGALSLGVVLWGAGEVAARVAGGWARPGAMLAVAMWSWMGWHAASAMESALTAALVLTAWWLALDWYGRSPDRRSAGRAWALAAVAFALPLTRPDSAPLALTLGLALALWPAEGRPRRRWMGLAGLAPVAFHPLFWWAMTGSPGSNGATVKWLPRLPYVDWERFVEKETKHLEAFGRFWMDEGGRWTADFFPPWVAAVAAGAGLLVAWPPYHRSTWAARSLLTLGTLGCLVAVLTFNTFPDHRFRYVVPYIPPFLVLGAIAFYEVGRLLGSPLRVPWLGVVTSLALGASFFVKWEPALAHYARASDEIASQHYRMARRFDELPESAHVAINDAGALTYLGSRRTFDVVGLTSNAATPYFVGGGGSQFELFEAMPADRRPTHFAIYRYWWRAPGLLGRRVAAVRIRGPLTIVGHHVMVLHEARYRHVGLGERPVLVDEPDGPLIDAVDVADVLDERRHDYDVEGDRYGHNVYRVHGVPGVGRVHEGGRIVKSFEQMRIAGIPGRPLSLVLRTDARHEAELTFEVGGEDIGRLHVPKARGWAEHVFRIPAEHVRERNHVVVRRTAGRMLASFHWWAYAGASSD